MACFYHTVWVTIHLGVTILVLVKDTPSDSFIPWRGTLQCSPASGSGHLHGPTAPGTAVNRVEGKELLLVQLYAPPSHTKCALEFFSSEIYSYRIAFEYIMYKLKLFAVKHDQNYY